MIWLANILFIIVACCGWSWDSGWDSGDIKANKITVNTSNFDTNLSSADSNVQSALETLDDLVSGAAINWDDQAAIDAIAASVGWTKGTGTVYTSTATDNVGIGSTAPRGALDLADGYIYGNGSQLTGISATDTNAGTICAGGNVYLNGEGQCVTIDNTIYQTAGTYITGATANRGLVATGTGLGLIETCNSGEIVKWNGSAWACATDNSSASSGTPGGSSTQIQYNNAGVFGGVDGFVYNGTKLSYTGNLGLGSTDPAQKLDVNGTVKATAFTGNLTGNVTGDVSGNAGTVTNGVYTSRTINGKALSSNITLSQYDIDLSLYAKLLSPTFTTPNIGTATGSISGNAGTATALAANGTNCGTGYYPKGVDASGNAESCVLIDSTVYQVAGSYLTSVTADSPLSGSGTSGSHLVLSTAGTWAGNAGTASALAANGTNCASGYYPKGVDAAGNAETCILIDSTVYQSYNANTSILGSTIAANELASADFGSFTCNGTSCTVDNDAIALGTQTTGNYAGSSSEGGAATTATALAANGSNCSAGSYPLGVDASGAVESCTAAPTAANPTVNIGLSTTNGSASTFMRSDAAPALAVNISPTWVGNHTFTPSSGDTKITAGNVGIGTYTPTQKLDVDGSVYARGSGNTLLNPSSGNVGIGSSAPGRLLDVAGSIEVDTYIYFATHYCYASGTGITCAAR